MMWLVDFKLDFLNDIDKSGGELRESKSGSFVLIRAIFREESSGGGRCEPEQETEGELSALS